MIDAANPAADDRGHHQFADPARIDWSPAILSLRKEVMWPDKPLEYSAVLGDEQLTTQHFGVFTKPASASASAAELVSVVSVWVSGGGADAQFRKFCTRSGHQRRGLGSALLRHCFEALRAECPGLRRVWCNARVEQAGFYSKHFAMAAIPGSEFQKGGRDFVLMETQLRRAPNKNRRTSTGGNRFY